MGCASNKQPRVWLVPRCNFLKEIRKWIKMENSFTRGLGARKPTTQMATTRWSILPCSATISKNDDYFINSKISSCATDDKIHLLWVYHSFFLVFFASMRDDVHLLCVSVVDLGLLLVFFGDSLLSTFWLFLYFWFFFNEDSFGNLWCLMLLDHSKTFLYKFSAHWLH